MYILYTLIPYCRANQHVNACVCLSQGDLEMNREAVSHRHGDMMQLKLREREGERDGEGDGERERERERERGREREREGGRERERGGMVSVTQARDGDRVKGMRTKPCERERYYGWISPNLSRTCARHTPSQNHKTEMVDYLLNKENEAYFQNNFLNKIFENSFISIKHIIK